MTQKSRYQGDNQEDIPVRKQEEEERVELSGAFKEPKKRDKERIQLDFSPDALEKLDQMKEIIGASTRAETIRQALRLFEWFVTELRPSDTITVTDEEKEIVTKFSVKLIRGTMESS
ncbi:MAG TPA: hypothetical protein VFB12_16230 [Ktedonobacteraceae bacterium]|nr:hypothetical protein [Ktedonobacteraceae bacterium]